MIKSNILQLISLFILNIGFVAAQDNSDSGTRVWGLGYGTFIIIIAFAISFLICLLSGATAKPEIVSLAGLALPLVCILFFVLNPKQADKSKDQQQDFTEDKKGTGKILMLTLLVIGGVLCLLWEFNFNLFILNETRKPSNWYRDRDDAEFQKLKEQQRQQELGFLYQKNVSEQKGQEKEIIHQQDWTGGKNVQPNPESMEGVDMSRKHNKEYMERERDEKKKLLQGQR